MAAGESDVRQMTRNNRLDLLLMTPPLSAMPKGFEVLQRRDVLVAPTGLEDFRDVA
jgi:hypothetical protein